MAEPGKGVEHGRVQGLLSIHEELESTAQEDLCEERPQQNAQYGWDTLSCDALGLPLMLNMGDGVMHILPPAACLLILDAVGFLSPSGSVHFLLFHHDIIDGHIHRVSRAFIWHRISFHLSTFVHGQMTGINCSCDHVC